MGNLAHNPQNDNRYADLEKEVRELGRAAAAGKDSLPQFAHRLVRAAADGVISTDKDRDGRDHAAKLYEEYVKAESKKAIHEHTDGGVKANVSKARKLIEFGVMPIIDPVAIINNAYTLREKMHADGIKLKPAYAAYVDLAREQLDNPGRELTDDEIMNVLRRDAPKDKKLEDVLKKIHKDLEGLVTGDRKDGLKDQSAEIIAAEEFLRTRLAAMLQAIEDDKLEAELAKRGMVAVHAIEHHAAA